MVCALLRAGHSEEELVRPLVARPLRPGARGWCRPPFAPPSSAFWQGGAYKCRLASARRTWPAIQAGGGRGPAIPATPGLGPELSRLRGHAEAGEHWLCPSAEEPSPQLSRVREIIPNLPRGWSMAVRRWARGSLVTDNGHRWARGPPSWALPRPGLHQGCRSPSLRLSEQGHKGRRRKRGGTALIQIPNQPPCVDFILSSCCWAAAWHQRGAPEGSREPLQGSLSAATSPHQALLDKKTSFYFCGKHMSISPVGNAPAGWYAGGSPSSSTGSSTAWCRSQTAAPSTGSTCCSPLLPHLRRCGRGYVHPSTQ